VVGNIAHGDNPVFDELDVTPKCCCSLLPQGRSKVGWDYSKTENREPKSEGNLKPECSNGAPVFSLRAFVSSRFNCDGSKPPKATSMRVDSQAVAPSSHPIATLKPPPGEGIRWQPIGGGGQVGCFPVTRLLSATFWYEAVQGSADVSSLRIAAVSTASTSGATLEASGPVS